MAVADTQAGGRRWWFGWAALLVGGVLLQLLAWWRAVWPYPDQVELYTLGLEWAGGGRLEPFGKLMTGDVPIPGVVLQLLIGLPLEAWLDFRAPTLLLVGFHLAAALLLSRTLAEAGGVKLAAVYLAVFWLSPWRLYHSGFLWEPNYLFLPAAVHLWACYRLRERAAIGPSLALAATLLLTAQVHASFLVLLLATLALAAGRRIRLSPAGAALGTLLGALPLLPSVLAWAGGQRPEAAMLPEGMLGLLGRLGSVQKALLYWFRMSSLDVGRRFRQTVWCEPPGLAESDRQALCATLVGVETLALASVLLSLAAGWWWWRRWRTARRTGDPAPEAASRWFAGYALAVSTGTLAAAALSPVLIQGWHVLIAMPAACLPVAFWIAGGWPRHGPWLRRALLLSLVLRLPAALLLVYGHPNYATPDPPGIHRHLAPVEMQPLFGGAAGRPTAADGPSPAAQPPPQTSVFG